MLINSSLFFVGSVSLTTPHPIYRGPRCGLMILRSVNTSSHSKKASSLIDQKPESTTNARLWARGLRLGLALTGPLPLGIPQLPFMFLSLAFCLVHLVSFSPLLYLWRPGASGLPRLNTPKSTLPLFPPAPHRMSGRHANIAPPGVVLHCLSPLESYHALGANTRLVKTGFFRRPQRIPNLVPHTTYILKLKI